MSFLIGLVGFLLIIVFFVLIVFFSIIRNAIGLFGRRKTNNTQSDERMARQYVNKKIPKEEGEYVDFEEVKEE